MSALRLEMLGKLKAYVLVAKGLVATSGALMPASSRDAIAGSLEADNVRISRLSPAGNLWGLEDSRWMMIAETTWNDIAAQMVILKGAMPTWNRVWGEIVKPTGESIASGAQEIASTSLAFAPWVLVLGIVVVLMVLTGNVKAIMGR